MRRTLRPAEDGLLSSCGFSVADVCTLFILIDPFSSTAAGSCITGFDCNIRQPDRVDEAFPGGNSICLVKNAAGSALRLPAAKKQGVTGNPVPFYFVKRSPDCRPPGFLHLVHLLPGTIQK